MNLNDLRMLPISIDRELAINPEAVGERRIGSIRVVVVPPLGIHFRVSSGDRQVLVLAVWSIK